MYEIDKKEFGAFVAKLRKERGMTQKDLAEKLFLSDKAVSKWETGVSVPDTGILVPLAQALGVSVSELMMQKKIPGEDTLPREQVEDLVKTTLSYRERPASRKLLWAVLYIAALAAGAAGMWLCAIQGPLRETVLTGFILSLVFGAYFCFLAKGKLPDYYDSNRISGVMDGPFRMNVPGLRFNNSNWPYILLTGKLWSLITLGALPLLDAALTWLVPGLWEKIYLWAFLALLLGGLFLPMYIVGKKYE